MLTVSMLARLAAKPGTEEEVAIERLEVLGAKLPA
jgi:hypothetical protein